MNKGLKMLALSGARKSQDDRYDMDSRFRDRVGREHYDDGRYAPVRSDMDSRWYPPVYDVEINRYEYGKERHREDMRGGYDSDRREAPEHREDPKMRMIGFDRDIEMTSGRSKQSNGLRAIPGGAKMHHEAKMDEHTARKWAAMMENEDGTTGPHWSMEQVKKVIEQRGMPGDPVEIWVAMNMMYSDYCKVAKKLGVNTMDFYAEMARAFLDDKDAGVPDKLTAYYEYIVKG